MLGLRHKNANNAPRDIIGDFDSSYQGQISRRSLEGPAGGDQSRLETDRWSPKR